MKLGRLYLPLGGHQAVITINASYGWNNNIYGLNSNRYHFPNYQLTTYIQSSHANFSRSIFPGSLENILSSPIFDNNNTSLFHSGYVVTTSPFIQPWGIWLSPVVSDNRNYVDVWFRAHQWSGPILCQITQITGNFTRSTEAYDEMPRNGFVQLDMYANTLTQIYKNPYNEYVLHND